MRALVRAAARLVPPGRFREPWECPRCSQPHRRLNRAQRAARRAGGLPRCGLDGCPGPLWPGGSYSRQRRDRGLT
ncbi:hypothetical protein [Actinomadura sp. 21ATH]|uniref:hypothetical protein n=1 Tax=Actinomadura sp. 21ATH TaxID=1735444 RepID=UPI0035C04F88